MASKFDNDTNEHLVDEYCDQDEDDLGGFIVYSDDEEEESLKHKQQQQQELEDEAQQELQDEEDEEVEKEEEVEEEEEEEEEEAPVGQQEILSLREQLKEEIRRKNAAMAASACKTNLSSSKNQMMPPVKDGYGTFFGPSKPVLARRVIEEGCSTIMKDLQNVPSKKDVSMASKMRSGTVEKKQKLKVVSEEKRKADALRKNRDYSSLFSDDADTHPPTKDLPKSSGAPLLVLKSETQDAGLVNSARKSVNSARKSRVLTDQPATLSPTDHGLKGSGSLGKKGHAERKGNIAPGRNGSSLSNLKKKSPGLLSSSKAQELQPSLHNKRPQASIPCQKLRKQSQSQRPQGQGSVRQPPLQGRNLPGQLIGQNRTAVQNGRLKSAQKQLIHSSKFKASHEVENRTVKRRKSNDDRQIIHKYDELVVSDGDESDMETDFATIQREERRSAAHARKEDQEQLRLIEEERRRERAMKRKRAAPKE